MQTNKYMHEAIQLAKLGRDNTFTNPLVGAVIVKNNQIIGAGYHATFGGAHAEINAINNALAKQQDLTDATIYVTLEPCTHTGKTPPCCDALTKYKFKQVIIGQLDPNPLVAGKGVQLLEANGIKTKLYQTSFPEIEELNTNYNFFYRQQRPFVIVKYATTFDGKSTLKQGERFQLTGKKSLADLYVERAKAQAILIGSGTQTIDNPKLTIRKEVKYPPARIVIDHRLRIQLNANLLQDDTAPTYIFTHTQQQATASKLQQQLTSKHVKFYFADHWDATSILRQLTKIGIQSVFIEGGPTIQQSFLNAGLIDKLIIYQAPFLFGNDSPSAIGSVNTRSLNYMRFNIQTCTMLDQDIKIIATPKETICLQV